MANSVENNGSNYRYPIDVYGDHDPDAACDVQGGGGNFCKEVNAKEGQAYRKNLLEHMASPFQAVYNFFATSPVPGVNRFKYCAVGAGLTLLSAGFEVASACKKFGNFISGAKRPTPEELSPSACRACDVMTQIATVAKEAARLLPADDSDEHHQLHDALSKIALCASNARYTRDTLIDNLQEDWVWNMNSVAAKEQKDEGGFLNAIEGGLKRAIDSLKEVASVAIPSSKEKFSAFVENMNLNLNALNQSAQEERLAGRDVADIRLQRITVCQSAVALFRQEIASYNNVV